MQVDLWTSNTEQKLQLLEQILVLFNPTLNIHTNDNALDWSTLSYVELISTTWSMRAIPSGVDDIIDISTLTFQLPVLINPPAKVIRNTVIHTIIDNIDEVNDAGLESLRAGGNYTPIFTSYKVVTLDQYKMKFEVNSSGSATAQLLNQNGSNLDSAGNILSWESVFEPFGEFRDDVSQLRLKQTNDPGDTTGDVVGTITVNTSNKNLLDIVLDNSTTPSNTQDPVDAVIDPELSYPGDGTLTAANTGDRYLILKDLPTGVEWAGATANANDIIQYDGAAWNVVFDASAITSIEYTTNTTTLDSLKWTGSQWINSFEGTYNPGFWRLYL